MLGISFMVPYLFWIGAPLVLLAGLALAWYSTKLTESTRSYFGELALLGPLSPKTVKQTRSLWAQWIAFFVILVTAAAGPSGNDTPSLARAGALQVMMVYDVSNSCGAEDYRAYVPPAPGQEVPGSMYAWGTRCDMARLITERDLLPMLKDNEVGLVTVAGVGYNMWDLTRDHGGALKYELQNFLKPGAAPGGGADYTSGLRTALKGFDSMGKDDSKERFIVLFADGGFTGDPAELDKVLAELNKRKIHLLIVGLGGLTPISVPTYDSTTKQRNGAYEGTTAYEKAILEHMRDVVQGSVLIHAAPGSGSVKYNFPAKAGGLYAVPKQSNLYPWLLLVDMLLLVSITFGGGGLPRRDLVVPLFKEPYDWVKGKISRS